MTRRISLDRRKQASEVYNDPLVKWYQNGVYFTGDGRPCRNLPNGTFRLMTDEEQENELVRIAATAPAAIDVEALARENAELRAKLAQTSSPQPQPVGTAPMPQPETTDEEPVPNDRLEALMAMPAAKVKSIFDKADGPAEIAKGAGAQRRMADWLIENTAA